MRVILNDINPEITEAWRNSFEGVEDVSIINSDFRDLANIDIGVLSLVLTTAGNSYGVMGGGLDLCVARKFPGIEGQVRREIKKEFYGELPVGSVIKIGLTAQYKPFYAIIYTPTMRAPITLYSVENVYLATRAALRAFEPLWYSDKEKFALVLPGFGGQCGQLKPSRIAEAMRLAYDNHMKRVMPQTTLDMRLEHKKIGSCNDG